MVGWSRRSRESSERRRRWWNSLTEEQKADALIREAAGDKTIMKWVLAFFGAAFLICVIKIIWDVLK